MAFPERVFPVGRLEYHSTGLVLLTNDGDLANRVLQSDNLRQTYQMKLKTLLTFSEIENLSRATGARISRLKGKEMPWYEVTLSEARRDALRNKLFQTGHPVEKIKRVGIGNLRLESLPTGQRRELSSAEIDTLTRMLDGKGHDKEHSKELEKLERSRRPAFPARPLSPGFRARADQPSKAPSRRDRRSFEKDRPARPERPGRPRPSKSSNRRGARPANAKRPNWTKKNRPHS